MERRGFFRAIAAGLTAALLPAAPETKQLAAADEWVPNPKVFAVADFDEMLTPEQAERFLRYAMDMSEIANKARIVPFRVLGARS